jgi:hypothetical protein
VLLDIGANCNPAGSRSGTGDQQRRKQGGY